MNSISKYHDFSIYSNYNKNKVSSNENKEMGRIANAGLSSGVSLSLSPSTAKVTDGAHTAPVFQPIPTAAKPVASLQSEKRPTEVTNSYKNRLVSSAYQNTVQNYE